MAARTFYSARSSRNQEPAHAALSAVWLLLEAQVSSMALMAAAGAASSATSFAADSATATTVGSVGLRAAKRRRATAAVAAGVAAASEARFLFAAPAHQPRCFCELNEVTFLFFAYFKLF